MFVFSCIDYHGKLSNAVSDLKLLLSCLKIRVCNEKYTILFCTFLFIWTYVRVCYAFYCFVIFVPSGADPESFLSVGVQNFRFLYFCHYMVQRGEGGTVAQW